MRFDVIEPPQTYEHECVAIFSRILSVCSVHVCRLNSGFILIYRKTGTKWTY